MYLPSRTTLVVHLRMGDVLDRVQNLQRAWETGEGTLFHNNHYVLGRAYYENVSVPEEIESVVLVGSNVHKSGTKKKGEAYVNLVSAHFRKRGLQVSWRGPNHTPDDDFGYMSQASYFLPSGGGYSHAVAQTVTAQGGVVLVL
jgi:hypothetical protein